MLLHPGLRIEAHFQEPEHISSGNIDSIVIAITTRTSVVYIVKREMIHPVITLVAVAGPRIVRVDGEEQIVNMVRYKAFLIMKHNTFLFESML